MVCPFCDISGGRADASLAYEDQRIIAFADLRPVNPGHLLVVPRRHLERLSELDGETGRCVWDTAVRLAAAVIRSGGPTTGVNLWLSDGNAAGQEVPHVHVHVIPRHPGDGLHIDTPAWRRPRPSRAELDRAVAAIRSADSA